jgi:hypothetical protein
MNTAYPNKTEGSKIARRNRERCNSLTDAERKKYHAAAMRRIYKGKPKTGSGFKSRSYPKQWMSLF